MKANNPMKNSQTIAAVSKYLWTAEHRQRMSKRMKKLWKEGKITSAHRRLIGKKMNKTESLLSEVIRPMGFIYKGNGDFWIAGCQSGMARNPDFIWKSGKNKIALLMHGKYWHTMPNSNSSQEMRDYKDKGWSVFVLWVTNHMLKKHLEPIRTEIKSWLDGRLSSRSKTQDIRQFTI